MASGNATSQILAHLASKSLVPSSTWLDSILSSQRPNTPLQSLQSTVTFRLLASDFTQTLQQPPASLLPSDISNGQIQHRVLAGPIPVQVLDIDDIGKSKWSQIEAIESVRQGETARGRQVIRTVPGEEGLTDNEALSTGPHKLTVQDAAGTRIFAFELVPVSGVSTTMNIGAKLVLSNVVVARGVAMIDPASCTLLGGKIESLDTAWKTARKDRLLAAIQTDASSGA